MPLQLWLQPPIGPLPNGSLFWALTRPDQVVLKTMPAQDVTNYQKVKPAILDSYEVTEES